MKLKGVRESGMAVTITARNALLFTHMYIYTYIHNDIYIYIYIL